MKKRILIISAVLLAAATAVAVVFFSCKSDELTAEDDLATKVNQSENATYNFKNGETTAPESYNAYRDSAQSFSINILRALYKENKNAFFSPAALYGQLSLTENAAAGASRTQIRSLLSQNLSTEELNSGNGYFFSRLAALSDSSENSKVEIKSNFFFSDSVPVGQNFIKQNADFYSQGLFRLNYGDQSTLGKINRYIASQSGGLNGSLVPELNPEKEINLTETVNFSDSWLAGFGEESISKGNFNGKGEAAYLNSREYFLKTKGCTGFIKDYKNTPCKFVAILPDGDLETFIAKFDSVQYQKLIDSMDIMTTCEASMPTFSAGFEGDLAPAVRSVGIKNIFTDSSNLNGLSYNCTAKVDRIMQSAKFGVTASGTDGGSADISSNTKPKSKNKVELNRPFIYMVVDNESYIPVLMGVITDYEAIS